MLVILLIVATIGGMLLLGLGILLSPLLVLVTLIRAVILRTRGKRGYVSLLIALILFALLADGLVRCSRDIHLDFHYDGPHKAPDSTSI